MTSAEPASGALVTNPPGLPAIAYRSGTQASVLRRMLDSLAIRLPKLVAADDDPGVWMLDAFATVADVVTFYQERIANEGYLGTATERRSVLELARSIGYQLRPGVAAATVLDLRTQAGTAPATGALAAPTSVVVPKRTRVLSVPGPGELPLTFETDEEITLDAACDEIPLVRSRPQVLGPTTKQLYLAGVATGLRAGDPILVVEGFLATDHVVPAAHDFRVLRTVEAQATAGGGPRTLVTWDEPLEGKYLQPDVYAFGVRGAFYGFNAPDWRTLPRSVRVLYDPTDPARRNWPGFEIPKDRPDIDLDTARPDLGPGSFLVLVDPETVSVHKPPHPAAVYRVLRAEPSAREDFGFSARTTRVTLERNVGVTVDRRRTTIHTLTRRLALTAQPILGTVSGRTFALDQPAPLVVGRTVLVTGMVNGVPTVEQATIASAVPPGKATVVALDHDLPAMDLASVRILGNIVAATHGETVPDEVLGSGDGTVPNQRFVLKKPSVTHVPGRGPGGVVDSLEIRVDGLKWTEIPSLYLAGPLDRVYVVRIDDDAVATVIFGDGEHGARLPTGQENVVATYRTGIGPEGEVDAHTLAVLPQRPPGVATVDNPFPAGGAAPPETLAEARTNAPLAVVTLDRVVALRDYEDFARAYGGIAKARAVALRGSRSLFVALTVAGTDGKAVPPPTVHALEDALDAVRDQAAEVRVLGYTPTRFRLGVAVLAEPDREAAAVRVAVADALHAAFAVQHREFGQPVTVAEVLTETQRVEGVLACRVTDLRPVPPPPAPGAAPEPPRVVDVLTARDARLAPTPNDPDHVAPAELLLVDEATLDVAEMTAP